MVGGWMVGGGKWKDEGRENMKGLWRCLWAEDMEWRK